VATGVLVVKAVPRRPHLGLLSVYLPVIASWLCVRWRAYMFFLGYGAGRTVATIYNRIVAKG
jgi:hypothetical protein